MINHGIFLGDEVILYGGLDLLMLVHLMVIKLRILLNRVDFLNETDGSNRF